MKLPSGWNLTKLSELLLSEPRNGYSPNCVDHDTGKYILGLGNLTEAGLDLSSLKNVPIDDKRISPFLLMKGDFLISRSNTPDKVGRLGVFKSDLKNCYYPDLMMRFRLDTSKVSIGYAEQFLSSSRTQRYFRRCAAGSSSSMVKINKEAVRSILLIIPSFPEQKAIASIFYTWEAAIEKTERLIAAKESAYRVLLDRLVFLDRNSAWKEMRLGNAFRERNETQRSDLPLLSISRDDGITLRDDTNRKDTSTEDKSKYLRICPGDIGYNTMRMWQGVSALSRLEGIVSPAYTVCIPNGEKIDGIFASFLFKHPWMIHQFYRHSQGLTSDTWNLKFHHFAEIKIWVPPVPTQRAIAAELGLAGKEIALLKQKAEALRRQKRGLMQKLLTGEWRIRPEIVSKYEEAQDE